MDFQKFSRFFQVVGLCTFKDVKFVQNRQKMRFYMAKHGKTCRIYYEVFKKHSRKIQALFYPISLVFTVSFSSLLS